MEPDERDEVVALLKEELREFIAWSMDVLGGDYYLENPEDPLTSWDRTAEDRVRKRLEEKRADLWERDRYAFFDHALHPSVYSLLGSDDLEIVHYLEEIYCTHDKIEEGLEEEGEAEERYEEDFGVLLASRKKGWMYRLDFCRTCGLVEVWSMRYDEGEISLYKEEEGS